ELRPRGAAQRDPPEALDLLSVGRVELLREQPVQQPDPVQPVPALPLVGRRHRLAVASVDAQRPVDEADPMPEQDAQPEVEILDLVDALAEASARRERAAADHHRARLADPVLFEAAADELREQVSALVDAIEPREAVVRSRVLLPPARVDVSVDLDLARGEDEPDTRVFERDREHLLQTGRRELVVGVQELHVPAPGETDYAVLVSRLAEPDRARLDAQARVRIRPRDLDGGVRRGVVADDELEVGEGLRQRRLDRLAEPPLGVVGGNADRNERFRLQPGGLHAGTRSPSVRDLPSRSATATPNRSSTVAGTSSTCPPPTVRPASTPGPRCHRRTCVVCSPERRKWSSRAGFETVPMRGELTLVIGNSC